VIQFLSRSPTVRQDHPHPNAEINQLDAASRRNIRVRGEQSSSIPVIDSGPDTGSVKFGPLCNGFLPSESIFPTIGFSKVHFPSEVAPVTSYLNDMH
jgi:hypothetical protein